MAAAFQRTISSDESAEMIAIVKFVIMLRIVVKLRMLVILIRNSVAFRIRKFTIFSTCPVCVLLQSTISVFVLSLS